ncbi:hypothetical protein niasHS_000903 [Heterodera schachtii]|uniref:G-protein coupled receptors family 1 profile domain-containing protein n=1 Tax=Heterodera schachtii TaxID=97005 RepID=A0ABD2KI20_HETSC
MENTTAESYGLDLKFLNESKHSVPLLLMLFINAFVNICGIVFDTFLIITTIKNRSLHNACHILIALQRLSSIFGFFQLFLPLSVLLWPSSDQRSFFSNSTCFCFQSVLFAFLVNIFTLMFAIGFDRLLCVFFPIWYRKRNAKFYSAVLFILSVLYPLYTTNLLYTNLLAQPNDKTMCTMGSSLGHDGVIIATFANICIIYSSVICYLILYAKLKWDERKANGITVFASPPFIFKSISLILLLQVVGWSGGIIAFFVVSIHFGDDDLNLQKFLANSVINCFVCVCGTFETPVLFFHSSEHQKAMRKEWRNIVQLVKKCSPTTFGRNNKIGTAVVLVVSRPGKPTAKIRGEFGPFNPRIVSAAPKLADQTTAH